MDAKWVEFLARQKHEQSHPPSHFHQQPKSHSSMPSLPSQSPGTARKSKIEKERSSEGDFMVVSEVRGSVEEGVGEGEVKVESSRDIITMGLPSSRLIEQLKK